MSTDENFNEFYSNTLSSELITLDKSRLAMKKKNFFVFLNSYSNSIYRKTI